MPSLIESINEASLKSSVDLVKFVRKVYFYFSSFYAKGKVIVEVHDSS